MVQASRRSAGALALAFSCIVLAYAGCASDSRPRNGEPSAAAERAARLVPEMEATGTFFSGQIEAAVVLNRTGFRGKKGDDKDQARGAPRGGGGVGGGGSFGGGRGGRHRGGEGGGGEMGGPRGVRNEAGGAPVPRVVASNEPPVRLHLRLTNHSATPVEVAVRQFDSDLGNFVVQPAKLVVPANASVDADPMTSRLGVTTTDIPLSIELRVNGQTEKQTLSLRPKPSAPKPVDGDRASAQQPVQP